jgi:hypothetical protein
MNRGRNQHPDGRAAAPDEAEPSAPTTAEAFHRCPASSGDVGERSRCRLWRGHPGAHEAAAGYVWGRP